MKKKVKETIACIGFIVFLMAASGIDVTEHLFIQTLVTFAGLLTFYFAGRDLDYEEEDTPDD